VRERVHYVLRFTFYVFNIGATVAVLLAGAAYWAWHDLTTPVPLPAGGALVSVAAGEPFRTTAARLQAAGVLRHAETLRWWARWQRLDRGVRSGDYRFEQALTPLEVLAVLRSPAAALHRVTIPEGSTLDQVAALLAGAGFGGSDEFLCVARNADFLLKLDLPASGLEGYAFPDTYAFSWSMSPEQVLTAMVQRFHDQTAALETRRRELGMSTPDVVIVASIIEREAAAPNERPLVSAVFQNRLRLGMPLQSDPTAVYGRDVHGAPTAADLTVDTPYNTYLHAGLPPGPICNPGRAALDAALNPAHVPYLYFVSRKDGTHAFSSTLEEHNRAVARFQRGGEPSRSSGGKRAPFDTVPEKTGPTQGERKNSVERFSPSRSP
jgi:peptidoglycan lytic transglycosylase G